MIARGGAEQARSWCAAGRIIFCITAGRPAACGKIKPFGQTCMQPTRKYVRAAALGAQRPLLPPTALLLLLQQLLLQHCFSCYSNFCYSNFCYSIAPPARALLFLLQHYFSCYSNFSCSGVQGAIKPPCQGKIQPGATAKTRLEILFSSQPMPWLVLIWVST